MALSVTLGVQEGTLLIKLGSLNRGKKQAFIQGLPTQHLTSQVIVKTTTCEIVDVLIPMSSLRPVRLIEVK